MIVFIFTIIIYYCDFNCLLSLQGRRSFQNSDANDSNPGHSNDIRDYVQPSMLEDPWKDLMAEMENKS